MPSELGKVGTVLLGSERLRKDLTDGSSPGPTRAEPTASGMATAARRLRPTGSPAS